VGEREVHARFWIGKSEEMRPLESHNRGWEDNIKMDIGKIGWGYGLDSFDSRSTFGFYKVLGIS
jgi:hypothetical protein